MLVGEGNGAGQSQGQRPGAMLLYETTAFQQTAEDDLASEQMKNTATDVPAWTCPQHFTSCSILQVSNYHRLQKTKGLSCEGLRTETAHR